MLPELFPNVARTSASKAKTTTGPNVAGTLASKADIINIISLESNEEYTKRIRKNKEKDFYLFAFDQIKYNYS
ncbi:18479_t:CDS:2 [Gigaspora margarita]|uniref:18479_t:CDS:1 n=1 Tax=Gigaspora margarita TaxID=4874 RepID=A0ABN7VFJ1_GIGMA|nr:18479_t:CDS:2 [Gigaspora margarita]